MVATRTTGQRIKTPTQTTCFQGILQEDRHGVHPHLLVFPSTLLVDGIFLEVDVE